MRASRYSQACYAGLTRVWSCIDASDLLYAGVRRFAMAKLNVGFILARRFTLCALGNFVDVLRLAADEGDRSRPILCAWRVLSPTMDPIASSSGHRRCSPTSGSAIPTRFDYLVVVGGLVDEIENLHPDAVRFLARAAAAGVPLVGVCTGTFAAAPGGADAGLPRLRQLVPPRGLPRALRRLEPVSDQNLRRRPRPADLLGRGLLGASRRLHRRAPPRAGAGGEEPAHHDHRRGDGGGGAAARHAPGARHWRCTRSEGPSRHAAVDRRTALDRAGGGPARGQPAQARAPLPRGARA